MGRAEKDKTVNVTLSALKGHVGCLTCSNDDWGTIAYFIPRNRLQDTFEQSEMAYNGIYFLIGHVI